MHRWLQDKGKSREIGHNLEHPELHQATTSESLGYSASPFSSLSGIAEFSVSGSAACLLLAAVALRACLLRERPQAYHDAFDQKPFIVLF